MLKLKLNALATSCEELTHWKRPWSRQRLTAGGEGDNRGRDGRMASPTQWTWVWVNSGSWWWIGRPGVLRFMGSQRVRHDWATELIWTELKPLTVWVTTNCGKLLKRWDYQITWETCLLRHLYAGQEATVRTRDGTVNNGSKLGKECVKAVYCHSVYLTYMQSISWEMPGWMNHKLESWLPEEISITSDMQMTPSTWQKAKRN